MTRLIELLNVIRMGDTEMAAYVTKEVFSVTDLLVAQAKDLEEWYDIIHILNPPYLRTGYTMYTILRRQK